MALTGMSSDASLVYEYEPLMPYWYALNSYTVTGSVLLMW